MIKEIDRPTQKICTTYLGDKTILIADPNGSSRAGIAKTLVEMGARTSSLTMVGDYATAIHEVRSKRYTVIVTDFDMGKGCGLDLADALHEAGISEQNSFFVIVTGNSTQSAVADAADEAVDAYILKPYTISQFQQLIAKAIMRKAAPTPYSQLVMYAKNLIDQKKFDEAIDVMNKALPLNTKPSLALYYKGQGYFWKSEYSAAEDCFRQGLQHHEIHYKCLVGLYSALSKQGDLTEAYEVASKLIRSFPASSARLVETLKLAIVTKSFQDVGQIYAIYKDVDTRSEDLVRAMTAALIVAGKHQYQHGSTQMGVDYLRAAALAASGKASLIKEVVLSCVECSLLQDAHDALKRFSPEESERSDAITAKFALDNAKSTDAKQVIHWGRSAIDRGAKDPILYEILIKRCTEISRKDWAEEWASKAIQIWPAERTRFQIQI